MNEREMYNQPDDVSNAAEMPAEQPAMATETPAPVADSSTTVTTEPTAPAPEAEQTPVLETPAVAESPVDAAPAVPEQAVQATEQAAGEVVMPMSDSNFAEAVAATTIPAESVEQAPAATEEAPKAEKPAPVVITDELLARLQAAKDGNQSIEVQVTERIKGGLRVMFEGVKLFMPASHFGARSASDAELETLVNQTVPVQVFEIQKDETGKISIIVSRKNLVKQTAMEKIKVGETIEGTIVNVMPFGLFVDLGGIDGLVHISRISHARIEDPNTVFKKGQTVKAVVVEADPSKDRIALSMKELEADPWTTIENDYPNGSKVKGTVKRINDFGAFVELRPGIEGLLRSGELSWTKRDVHPNEFVQVGQELDIVVVSASADKKQISLSLRRLEASPWAGLIGKYPVGAETTGVVKQVIAQGAVITVGGEIDGFMPRSKMRDILRGKRIPYNPGDMVAIVVADFNADDQSLILEPKKSEDSMFGEPRERGFRGDRDRDRERGPRVPKEQEANANSSVSLMDLLSDSEKSNLFKSE